MKESISKIDIPTLADVSEGYRIATKKRDDLQKELQRLDTEAEALRYERDTASRADDVELLLAADDVSTALESTTVADLQQQLGGLAHRRKTIVAALHKAESNLHQEEHKAARLVGDAVRGSWDKMLDRQAKALAELANAMDDYVELQKRLPGLTPGSCGLSEAALHGPMGHKVSASINKMIASGLMKPDAVSSHWVK